VNVRRRRTRRGAGLLVTGVVLLLLLLSGTLRPGGEPSPGTVLTAAPGTALPRGGNDLPGPANTTVNASSWTNVSSGSPAAPPCVGDGTLAYDAALQEFVSFGGVIGCGGNTSVGGSTWTFANGTWTNRSTSLSRAPSDRYGMAMAYDAADGYVVAYGGTDGRNHVFNDTWTFNGTWSNITTRQTSPPPPRFNAGVVYDNATGSVLLVGGYNNAFANQNDTWSFAGGQWSAVPGVSSLPPLRAPGMIYDPATSSVLLYGGMGNSGPLGGTWSFANGTWTPLNPANSPPALWDVAAFYDRVNGMALLFGGYTGYVGSYYPDGGTWGYSAGSWTNLTASVTGSPSDRGAARVAWDGTKNFALLFGGRGAGANGILLNDSWEFSSVPLQSTTLDLSPAVVDLGNPVSLTAEPFGGAAPYSYNYSGLPPGCGTMNQSSFTCTPGATGTFQVGVNVTDAYDDFANNTSPLTVQPALLANLTATPLVLDAGQNVSFFAHASGGDGVYNYTYLGLPGTCPSENQTNVTCRVAAAGTYPVRLLVQDTTGASNTSLPVTVVVHGGVVVGLRPELAPLDLGENLTLYARTTGGSGTFSFVYQGLPPGCASRNATNLTCRPNATGNYTLSVRATDSLGESNVSAPVFLTIFPPLTVSFSRSTFPMEVWVSTVVTAMVTGASLPLTYTWGALPTSCAAAGPRLGCVPTVNGTFPIQLQVGDASGASVVASAVADVDGALSVSLVASRNATDLGTPISMTASVTGGVPPFNETWGTSPGLACTFAGALANCTASATGRVTAWYAVTDALGANENLSRSITVAPSLSVTLTESVTPSCGAPFNAVFTAHPGGGTPGYSYAWTFGDGGSSTQGPAAPHSFEVTGTYQVALTVDDQGGGNASVTLSVPIAATTSLCPHTPQNGTTGPAGNGLTGPVVGLLVAGLVVVGVVLALIFRRRRPPPSEAPATASTEPRSDELEGTAAPPRE
jgi:hypothetical protein